MLLPKHQNDAEEIEIVSEEEDPLLWAKQAYERLKKQQEEERKKNELVDLENEEQVPNQKEISNIDSQENKIQEPIDSDLLQSAVGNRESPQQQIGLKDSHSILNEASGISEVNVDYSPVLGEFDDTFTWSAEILAAQG